MVQKKKSDEQDVLVVRDEKTGEISVVAGLSRDGTPKRAPAKAENTSDFLRFDRNSDLMDSFFRNFFRQCKEPSRFGFYRIAADQVENLLGVMKELLKDPEANKEILSAHKVDTSNYEKEAKQSEGQAKESASSDDASKTQANTEKENVSSEQTNEKENDMEQKPEQTATEQQAQTAPGVKQNLISGNDVNLQELGALNLVLTCRLRIFQVLGKPLHEGRPATRKLRYLLHDGQFDRSLSSRILNGSFRNRFLHLSSIHYTRAVADNQFAGCRTDFLRCLLSLLLGSLHFLSN